MNYLFIALLLFSLNPLKANAIGLLEESFLEEEDGENRPATDIYYLELNLVSTEEFKNRLLEAFAAESSNYPHLESVLKDTNFKLSLKQIYTSFFRFYAKEQSQAVVDMHVSLLIETLESMLNKKLSSTTIQRVTLMAKNVFLPHSNKNSCKIYLK